MALTAEQIEFRKGKLSGSEAASALGLNPFKTPLEYWGILTGRIESHFEGNEDTRIGQSLESWIAGWAMNRLGVEIYENKKTMVDRTDEWLIGTPDYLDVNDRFGMECKNVGPHMAFKWGDESDPNGVPSHVVPQVATYSLITGIKTWYVAAYFGGSDLRVYQLIFTPELLARFRDRLRLFWSYVVSDIPPAPVPTDLETVKRMFAPDPGKTVVMSDEIRPWVEGYPQLKQAVKDAEEAQDLAKAQIAMYMKDATALVDQAGDKLFTFNPSKDHEGVDYPAAYLELAAEKFGADAGEREKFEKKYWKVLRKGGRSLLCKIK